MEQFEAADALATLVGQHGPFAEAKKHAEQAHEKCSIARLALEDTEYNMAVERVWLTARSG